jgi:hypothetical protein
MNMISTGAFQTEMDASNKQTTLAEKFAAVWEKKNAKAARAGGVSLMALSLAACGSDDATTTTTTDATSTTTTVTPAVGATMDLTPLDDIASGTMALNGSISNSFRFSDGNETVNAITATMQANDTLLDTSGTDADVMNITVTGDMNKMTAVDIETVNVTFAAGSAAAARLTNFTGTDTVNITGSIAGTLEDSGAATVAISDYGRTLTVDVDSLAGTAAAGNAEAATMSVSGVTFGSTAATQTTIALTVQGAADATDGVLETLNIASEGTAANTFALSTDADMTLSTINLSGAQAATVRVAETDVSGNTIVGTGDGAKRLSLDADSTGATPINAANWSGLDAIEIRDSVTTSATDAVLINSAADGTELVIKNSVGTTELNVQGAAYTGLKESVTLELNGSSTTAGVTVGAFGSGSNGQNIKALNIESLGLDSSTSTTAANTISSLVGDYTTITVTGDTSVAVTSAAIEAVQTASTTTARAVTIDASAMTGNAYAQFTAADDAKVSYTMIGTINADLLVANESGSSLTGGAGNDVLTGGAGNDTYDVEVTAAAASAQVTSFTNLATYTHSGVVADTLTITINGQAFTHQINNGGGTADIAAAASATQAIAALKATVLNATGVTLTVDGTDTDLVIGTGAADGTAFTMTAAFVDDSATGDPSAAITVATTADGQTALDAATTITDFAAGDIIDTVTLSSLVATGYFEGATADISASTTAAASAINVLTTEYTSAELAEDAVAAEYASIVGADDGIFIFYNSTTGVAEAYYDIDLENDPSANALTDINQILTFSNITNTTDLAAAFSSDSFVI